MKIKLSILFLIFLLLLSSSAKAQLSSVKSLHSPSMVKKFADYLFCQKDYLRSFYEYRNYIRTQKDDTVRFKMALVLRKLKRYDEALTYFKGLFFNSDFNDDARNEYFKTLFVADRLNLVLQNAGNSFYQTEDSLSVPLKLSLTAALLSKPKLPDSSLFSRAFSSPAFKEMIAFYDKRKSLPYKAPATAALLSAVLPGAGKIYTENYGDGITAFLFTTVLGYLSYDNFRAHHQFRAWLFTGLTALFYGGNIYGSYAAAQIFNAKVRFNFAEEVKSFLNAKNYFVKKYNFLCN